MKVNLSWKHLNMLKFIEKNDIFLHGNCLWKYYQQTRTSVIIWPNNTIKSNNAQNFSPRQLEKIKPVFTEDDAYECRRHA